MPAFNLLPKDLTPKEGVVKVASLIKKVTIIGYSVLLVSLIGLVGGYFYINGQIKKESDEQDKLKNQISALEQTEIRLVLVKDRLKKVEEVNSLDSSADELAKFRSILEIFPEGVSLDEASMNAYTSNISLVAQNSSSLAEFLATLVSSGIYPSVKLNSLFYNSGSNNYRFELDMGG